MNRAVVSQSNECKVLTFMGNTMRMLVPSERTGGACAVVDLQVAAGFVAPPLRHRHRDMDWHGVVVEGEIAIELDGTPAVIATGGAVFVPRGVAFRWRNPHADRGARWILTYTPGGFERYFVEIIDAVNALGRPPTPQDLGALATPLWKKYGVDVVP